LSWNELSAQQAGGAGMEWHNWHFWNIILSTGRVHYLFDLCFAETNRTRSIFPSAKRIGWWLSNTEYSSFNLPSTCSRIHQHVYLVGVIATLYFGGTTSRS